MTAIFAKFCLHISWTNENKIQFLAFKISTANLLSSAKWDLYKSYPLQINKFCLVLAIPGFIALELTQYKRWKAKNLTGKTILNQMKFF